ncbi:hypothetical protein [Sinosporangium siamense]|uniref:ABC transporter permease n=1 Tax=Sinosporangium siamense TaxID=1367973 RepID=A0A919RCR6_9ACTN|nr:hypothetical protein [Sinosporangium siamense]GII90380.1 hypothetical protein Ssi02_06110 [Sinosporangium siamense]
MIDVVASEWLKLRSLRSTYYVMASLLSAVVLTGLSAFSISRYYDLNGPGGAPVGTGLSTSADVVFVLFGVLGVLAVSGEFQSGMIRLSLIRIRRPWMLIVAKAAVVAAVAAVAGQVLAFAAYFTAQAVVGARPIGASLSDPAALPEVLATGVGAAVAAVTGLCLATLLRSTAGALISVVAVMPGPAMIERFLPAPWNDWTGSLTITSLTRQLAGVPDSGAFGAAGAGAALLGYVVILILLAAAAITRRDA